VIRTSRTITTLALVIIAMATSVALGALPKSPAEHGRCFPAKLWGAEPSYRPCVQVKRVYEDGSFEAAIKDADGTTRVTFGVGNPVQ